MNRTSTNPSNLRVGMISLGCAKNLVDAEIMLGALVQDGMEITNDAAQADVLIVNTCSFIDAAQEESVDTILESAKVREAHHRGQALVVSGCLSQRFRGELPKLLPEVDAFMGIDQVAQVGQIVRQALEHRSQRVQRPGRARGTAKAKRERVVAGLNGASHPAAPLVQITARPQYIPDYATPRFRLTPRHFAYLKIAEGCNHPCSFCIIPRMRGAHRSRPMDDLLQEARHLLADGVKELNLISQDSTYYGLDLRPNRVGSIASPERFSAAAGSLPAQTPTLCSLLRELNRLPGPFWIRLLYTHPAHWTDELIQTIAECAKVARYIDMPLQHIHENMLERMRRETSKQHITDLLARIRAGIPGVTIRTTFIVGFPGETDACFETLLQFIRESRFERLGVFTYSHEEGTRAANMMHQIPDTVKKQRRKRAMAEQLQVARNISESFLGRTIPVLVEKAANATELARAQVSSWEHGLARIAPAPDSAPRGRYLVARGEADAPGIDGRIYIRGQAPLGSFAQVKIVGHTDYDLIGELA